MIERKRYLDSLIQKRRNGLVKVITGIRRCGKSFLLFNIFYNYMLAEGFKEDHIILLTLDDIANIRYRNPFQLDEYLKSKIYDDGEYYIFLDEIQKVEAVSNPYLPSGEKITFVDVLLSLMKKDNVDIYVTGSNSKMLSSDILSQFRGRSDEIRVNPLSYGEFYAAYGKDDKEKAWNEYITYGGMPYILSLNDSQEKSAYLKNLFEKVYMKDILERHGLSEERNICGILLDMISSSIGSLTNPNRLSHLFQSIQHVSISPKTISSYLDYFEDSFLIHSAKRYDIKKRKYMETPLKYYFTDVGLRNARINFRQQEETHLMENVLFNEPVMRGYDVDVGIVECSKRDENGNLKRNQHEVDFVCNQASQRYYIQSAFALPDEEKRNQKTFAFKKIPDSFRKIVVVNNDIIPWHDEYGILYIGVKQFLLDENAINL